MSETSSVVLLSGGLDSSALLLYLRDRGIKPLPITIHYGQRHNTEIAAAEAVSRYIGLEHRVVDLSGLRTVLGGSSQTDASIPVPHGHYADETMKVTVVPNRNMILLAVAAGYAISKGADSVSIANHAGDHAVYPDCRPQFIFAMAGALRECHYTPVKINAPFANMGKHDILTSIMTRENSRMLSEYFGLTWSCYEGGARHCGKCGTCVERKEAFALSGLADPTTYIG